MFQKQIQMNKICYLLLILVSFFGYSQNFKGEISDVKTTGLNQITIDPNIRAVAKDDLRFLRILDAKQNQVPYAFVTQKSQSESYSPFKMVSNISLQDSITTLIIQNEKRDKIDRLTLQIENTSLAKTYAVSGSNDGVTWFGLVENQILSDLATAKATSVSKTISFPTNTYKFLRMVFTDKNSLPLNIRSVGIAETQLVAEQLHEISDFTYEIKEDKIRKVTQIVFNANNQHQVDALSFEIATDYFNRNAKMLVKRKRKSNVRESFYDEILGYFKLNSKQNRTIYFDAINEKSFIIEINNQDNQPLVISAIKVLQKPILVVSKLNAGENYQVIIDTTLSKPTYDLEQFVAETAVRFPEVGISNFTKSEIKKAEPLEKAFWQTRLFMWICIVLGGALVAYFALGLLKDMKD